MSCYQNNKCRFVLINQRFTIEINQRNLILVCKQFSSLNTTISGSTRCQTRVGSSEKLNFRNEKYSNFSRGKIREFSWKFLVKYRFLQVPANSMPSRPGTPYQQFVSTVARIDLTLRFAAHIYTVLLCELWHFTCSYMSRRQWPGSQFRGSWSGMVFRGSVSTNNPIS